MSDVLVDFLSKTQWVNITRGVNPNSDGVKVFFWVYKTPENVEFRPRSFGEFFSPPLFFEGKGVGVKCWWRSNPTKVAPENLLESVNDVVDQLEDVVHQQNQPCTDAGGPPIRPLVLVQDACTALQGEDQEDHFDINIARCAHWINLGYGSLVVKFGS